MFDTQTEAWRDYGFNSTKERLILEGVPREGRLVGVFQLHEGAIDTDVRARARRRIRLFQLHEGAIDTPGPRLLARAEVGVLTPRRSD